MRLRLSSAGSTAYERVVTELRASYDASAEDRDRAAKENWKLDERAAFLDRLRVAEARTLLEVGAGTGQDSAWFQAEGLAVTAVDPSPAMVSLTAAKGVPARVADVLGLGLPESSFDAAYSLNVLLHVPNADFDDALRAVRTVLVPGGLFFLGVFGGDAEEGVADGDSHVPARFFSFRSDQQMLSYAQKQFDILDFHVVELADGLRFQALTLVRP
jgi:SAM-dependent methyltransferase